MEERESECISDVSSVRFQQSFFLSKYSTLLIKNVSGDFTN